MASELRVRRVVDVPAVVKVFIHIDTRIEKLECEDVVKLIFFWEGVELDESEAVVAVFNCFEDELKVSEVFSLDLYVSLLQCLLFLVYRLVHPVYACQWNLQVLSNEQGQLFVVLKLVIGRW